MSLFFISSFVILPSLYSETFGTKVFKQGSVI